MEAVARHYERGSLAARLEAALAEAGLGEGVLGAEALAPLDQFHSRGLAATMELARALGVTAGDEVLDIGAGLGGPSRYLAATFGCQVTGIDLSASFVEAAGLLAARAGLAGRVAYRQGDALALPFADGSFDLAWTQHVAMNIGDRAGMYGEAHRVLRPGGRLAMYDVVQGGGGALQFPVPWARGPEASFLLTAEAMRAAVEGAGFRVLHWADRTQAGAAWFAARPPAAGPLGLHVVMGPEFGEMTRNLGRNLAEGRAGLVEAVVARA